MRTRMTPETLHHQQMFDDMAFAFTPKCGWIILSPHRRELWGIDQRIEDHCRRALRGAIFTLIRNPLWGPHFRERRALNVTAMRIEEDISATLSPLELPTDSLIELVRRVLAHFSYVCHRKESGWNLAWQLYITTMERNGRGQRVREGIK